MKKTLETSEWMFILKALETISISGKDARGFVTILDKLGHQVEASMKKDSKLEKVSNG